MRGTGLASAPATCPCSGRHGRPGRSDHARHAPSQLRTWRPREASPGPRWLQRVSGVPGPVCWPCPHVRHRWCLESPWALSQGRRLFRCHVQVGLLVLLPALPSCGPYPLGKSIVPPSLSASDSGDTLASPQPLGPFIVGKQQSGHHLWLPLVPSLAAPPPPARWGRLRDPDSAPPNPVRLDSGRPPGSSPGARGPFSVSSRRDLLGTRFCHQPLLTVRGTKPRRDALRGLCPVRLCSRARTPGPSRCLFSGT